MEEKEEKQTPMTQILGEKDWFLQRLVEIINLTEGSMTITVTIPGFIITGLLINGKAYFNEFGNQIPESNETNIALKNSITKTGEDIYNKKNDEKKPQPPSYIHIRNAKIFHPDGSVFPSDGKGVLWRGKLTDVNSFFLGEYNTVKE